MKKALKSAAFGVIALAVNEFCWWRIARLLDIRWPVPWELREFFMAVSQTQSGDSE